MMPYTPSEATANTEPTAGDPATTNTEDTERFAAMLAAARAVHASHRERELRRLAQRSIGSSRVVVVDGDSAEVSGTERSSAAAAR